MDALTESQQAMTAYELAKAAKAPVSTIYRLIDELVDREMLSRTETGAVWLGPRLMRYGLVYRAHMDLFTEARREISRLCQRTGETVQVCGRDGDMMVVLAMADGGGHFRVTSDVGTRVPLNWTASGRLLLGHLPEAERLAAFQSATRPSETGMADTDPARLSAQSRDDFDANVAIQISNSEYSVACIAAPIRDVAGSCVLTISLVLSEQRAKEKRDELVRQVQASALAVERAMGRKAA